ncbi:MAG TPA: hypothetical protein PLD27_04250 [bacterium]|nr:hypothetical protein [bacterium]HOL48380.1 hypothetical protein [bacterium]HPQ19710.1 hypothetical protein [bacterium]
MYFLFVVDGDWLEYHKNQKVNINKFLELIEQEKIISQKYLNNNLIHLIHISKIEPTIFLKEPFLSEWRLFFNNGKIGLHCHFDIPNKESYYDKIDELTSFIEQKIQLLLNEKINIQAYRGGYCSFDFKLIDLFLKYNIHFDFSAIPGKKIFLYNNKISDWSNSPHFFYELKEKTFFEVPIGSNKINHLCLERLTEKKIINILNFLKERKYRVKIPAISIITHSYMFKPIYYSKNFLPFENLFTTNKITYKLTEIIQNTITKIPEFKKLLKIKKFSFSAIYYKLHLIKMINILKNYGEFININDLKNLINI